MKPTTLLPWLISPLLSNGAPSSPVPSRFDVDHFVMTNVLRDLPTENPSSVHYLRPTVDEPGVQRRQVSFGPYVLAPPSYSPSSASSASLSSSLTRRRNPATGRPSSWTGIATGLPLNATLVKGSVRVRGTDGKAAAGVFAEQVSFIDVTRVYEGREGSVDYRVTGGRGASSSSTILSVSDVAGGRAVPNMRDERYGAGAGYYLPEDSKILFTGELVNQGKRTQRVMIECDVEYVLGKRKGEDMQGLRQIDLSSKPNYGSPARLVWKDSVPRIQIDEKLSPSKSSETGDKPMVFRPEHQFPLEV